MEAAAALVGELVFTDVKEAIQYVEEWEGDDQETLTDNLASEWAQIEPEKALNWQLNQTGKQNSINNSFGNCLLYTSPSPRDKRQSRMPSSA